MKIQGRSKQQSVKKKNTGGVEEIKKEPAELSWLWQRRRKREAWGGPSLMKRLGALTLKKEKHQIYSWPKKK